MKKHYETSGYRTGPTQPPKSYGGLVAVLLVLVILMGGLVTAMGILNIRLFQILNTREDDTSITFTPEETALADEAPAALGLSAETVSAFLQSYYDLPQGVYITDVEENSAAHAAGLIPGDIITAIDGEAVSDAQTFLEKAQTLPAAAPVELTLYRTDGQQTVILMLNAEE